MPPSKGKLGKKKPRSPAKKQPSHKSKPVPAEAAPRRRPARKSKPIPSQAAPAASAPAEITERERVFIEHYLYHKAIPPLLKMQPGPNSVFERWTLKECARLLRDPRIVDEIRRRRRRQELLNARMRADSAMLAEALTPELAKAAIVKTIRRGIAIGQSRVLDLALVVTGVLADGELAGKPLGTRFPVYHNLGIRRIARPLSETVPQSAEIATAENVALPPAPLEKEEDEDLEILDY